MKPFIPYQTSKAAANNARALSQRAGVGGVYAGDGLARGTGQQALQQFRRDTAQAEGQSAADEIMDADSQANLGMSLQQRSMNDSARLAAAQRSEQLRQSEWSNRFNNLTTAWGALAGLLR